MNWTWCHFASRPTRATGRQSNDSGFLNPGSYSVSETPTPDWDLTSATCDNSNAPGAITLAAGQTVTCTFTNTQRGKIIVKKVTNPTGAAGSFTFTGDASGPIGDGGAITVSSLQPGTYTSTEADPTPSFDLTAIGCDDGSSATPSTGSIATRTATFKVDPGETVTCTFTNTQRGHIVVVKKTNPVGSPQAFMFTPSYNGGTTFALTDGQSNDSGPLVPGGYSVTETVPAGWDRTSAACDNLDSPSSVTLGAGKTVTCTFTNTQRGMAKVIKTVSGVAPSGTQSFTFQIRQSASASASGTTLEQLDANASNGGVINFTSKLVPGTTYALCEIVMPGWTTTLGPPFYAVYNPSGDNSTVCTDFTVQPGETRTFTIDNKPPPGGLARTIGFWKNWASCANSNGKQKPILDQTLQLGDLTIGTLVLHDSNADPNVASDCLQAVRLLSKQSVDTGKVMASDPAFNLAAQLLAAELNVQAGAGVCGAAVSAINNAQTLLAAIHFNGITHDKMIVAQTTQANTLATTLDNYNNNKLC